MLGPARVKPMGSFQRAECRGKELSCGAFEQTIDRLVSTTTAVWDGPRDERRQLSRQYTARRSWLNPGADDAIPLYDDGGPVLEPFGTGTTTMGRAGPTVRAECGTRRRQENERQIAVFGSRDDRMWQRGHRSGSRPRAEEGRRNVRASANHPHDKPAEVINRCPGQRCDTAEGIHAASFAPVALKTGSRGIFLAENH